MRVRSIIVWLVIIAVAAAGMVAHVRAASNSSSSPWGNGEDGDLTISSSTTYNINEDNHPGRSCSDGGDGVAYRVMGLNPTVATLASPPQPGCLAPGDEILLIKMQGNYTANVGVYEFLEVANVSGNTVTFTHAKAHTYGNAPNSDNGINGSEKVLLQRVPHYDTLALYGALTANAWNGVTGGVIVFRALHLQGSGTFQATGLGYRGGAGGHDDDNQPAYQGESLSPAGPAQGANVGGGGAGQDCGYNKEGGGGGGNYAEGAIAGGGYSGCGGAAGQIYGGPALSKLFLGSGGGGGTSQHFNGGPGGTGGGIVYVAAQNWTGFSGALNANGTNGQTVSHGSDGDGGGGSGGSIYIQGERVACGQGKTLGGNGGGDSGGRGGNGRIRID